jgi:hypothetical protein
MLPAFDDALDFLNPDRTVLIILREERAQEKSAEEVR